MKGTQQEAGIDGDFNPHLTGDHQIEDFGGGLKPDWARHKGFTLTKNLPSCLLPPAFLRARRAVKPPERDRDCVIVIRELKHNSWFVLGYNSCIITKLNFKNHF